jgi:hypothetical protein
MPVAATLLTVVAASMWAFVLFSNPWKAVRKTAAVAVRDVPDPAATDRLRSFLPMLTLACAEFDAVRASEGPDASPPPALTRMLWICPKVAAVESSLDFALPEAPVEPIAPVYEKPEYEGTFAVSGDYVQRSDGIVMERHNKLYFLPLATTVEGGSRGRARGYVRPLHRSTVINGTRMTMLDVVSKKVHRADRAAYRETVTAAEKAHADAVRAYEAAAERWRSESAAYARAIAQLEAARTARRAFLGAASALRADLAADGESGLGG